MLSLKEETVQLNHHTDISLCMVRAFQIKFRKSKEIFFLYQKYVFLSVTGKIFTENLCKWQNKWRQYWWRFRIWDTRGRCDPGVRLTVRSEEEEKKNSYLNGVKHPRASLYFPFNVQFTLKSCELTVFHYSHLQHTKILHPYHNYDRSIPTFASGMRLLLPSPDHQMYTMATSPPGGSQIFLWHLVRVRFNIRTSLKQN